MSSHPAPSPEPTRDSPSRSARERLRQCWLRFGKLANDGAEDIDTKVVKELSTGHRLALDELAARSEISASQADFAQTIYDAGVHHLLYLHTLRSKPLLMCYRTAQPPIYPSTMELVIGQAKILDKITAERTIDPTTLAKLRSAIEQNLASFVLNQEEENQAMYSKLLLRTTEDEKAELALLVEETTRRHTSEGEAATQFLIDLLTEK